VEAATQVLLGNIPEAISLFREVIKIDPNNHAAMYEIARLLVDSKKPAEAALLGNKARTLNPENFWYHSITADAYEQLNKNAEAEKVLVKMSELFPNEKETWLRLVELYVRTQQSDKALKALGQLENLAGTSPLISLQKFRILALNQKVSEAKQVMRNLIRLYPDNQEYYQYLHDYFISMQQADSAALVLEDLLKQDPSNVFSLIGLSQYYKAQGKEKEAAVMQARAMRSENMSPEAKIQLLLALSATLDEDRTLYPEINDMTNELIRILPENAMLMALRADLYRFENKLDSARLWLLKSLKLEGSNESLWENLLYLDGNMENYEFLMKDAEMALEYFPNNTNMLFMHGISAYIQKDYSTAKYALEKALKLGIDPQQESQALSTLAETLHYLGDHQKSDETFDKALELDKDNASTLNNYAYYLSLRNTQLDKAEAMVKKAIELMPGTASFEDTYGWILYQRGNYQEALIWIQKAMDKSPSPDVADHLGDVYYKLGNTAKAVEFWKKAKELGIQGQTIENKIKNERL
jgi:tetratricopeptide (TPR) repeat protein